MSWKAKPSGTMKIERRTEPYLSAELRERFDREVRPRYETPMGSLLPILHAVQDTYGFVAHQAMIEIATYLGIKPSDVLDTVSFYEEFHTHPVGRCVIAVCQSIACEVCGHQAILDQVRDRLGIEPHETTEDGRFTLLALECLGSCDTAPVALVNDDLHEGLTVEKMNRIIDEEAAKPAPPRPPSHGQGH